MQTYFCLIIFLQSVFLLQYVAKQLYVAFMCALFTISLILRSSASE